jgi:4'-phosphopantetheinyl transferase
VSAPTASATDTARVWWWRTSPTVLPDDLALLDATERKRAARFQRPAPAAEFVSCRAAVRRILAPLLGIRPAALRLGRRPCPGCGAADHGPPRVTEPECDWWISLAHSGGAGLLAVAGAPVGVDLERARDVPVEELAGIALSPTEAAHVRALPGEPDRIRAFLRCWTRKEAVLKGAGVGITADLTTIEAQPALDGPVTVAARSMHWSVAELPLPAGWLATVAMPADQVRPVQLYAHPGPDRGRASGR